jgi:hypothetical protein
MSLGTQRTKVFVSYSHKDSIWLEELRPHLGSLAREKGFASSFWDDTKIKAGSDWQTDIYDALNAAKVAILLISKYFLDSDFITTNELPPLLAAAKTEKAVILPIILSPCRFAHHPRLSKFQSINPPSEPLEGMTKVQYEAVFLKATELVDEALATPDKQFGGSESLAASAPNPPPPQRARRQTLKRSGAWRRKKTIRLSESTVLPGEGVLSRPDENWTRVVVQSLPDGSLQYQTIQNRVRFDCRLVPPQRRLVDDLAARSLSSSSFDRELAAALFELLIPNELKSRLFRAEGTLLILDSTTARYPWELLQEGVGTNVLPISLCCPVIRQTVADRFTPHPSTARHEALVIGDPSVDAPFVQLLGARHEAEMIANLLRNSGFTINCQIGGTAVEAIAALFSQPYQVLHLTGHGVYEYQLADHETTITGFVMGNGIFLTGAEVVQMRVAPEVVFLNASYLGRHTAPLQTSNTETSVRFSSVRFANSLPDQFIAFGSSAVIAPAGTVDDAAAGTFATTFYEAMFSGNSLGQAVLTARRKTYEQHPQSNTWGMYLCYGDPGYRFADRQLLSGEK